MDSYNRRRFQRIEFDGQASLDFNDRSYECCPIKNLSLTGMFVKGDIEIKEKLNCNVKIFHRDKGGNNSMSAAAEIVWWNDEGAGLKFTHMSIETYELLQETLSRKAEQPEVILREIPYKYPLEITK